MIQRTFLVLLRRVAGLMSTILKTLLCISEKQEYSPKLLKYNYQNQEINYLKFAKQPHNVLCNKRIQLRTLLVRIAFSYVPSFLPSERIPQTFLIFHDPDSFEDYRPVNLQNLLQLEFVRYFLRLPVFGRNREVMLCSSQRTLSGSVQLYVLLLMMFTLTLVT